MAARTARRSKSWKDIDQDVKGKTMSDLSRRRLRARSLKRAGLIFLGAVAGLALAQFALLDQSGPELLSKAGRALPVRSVEVESDGSLRDEWVVSYLQLEGDSLDLLTIDLDGLKASLEALPRVREAEATREYPDKLFIRIDEREPIARIVGQERSGDKVVLFVDAEGVVYRASDYEAKLVRSLPFLDGVRLKRMDGVIQPIEGLEDLNELLAEAKTIAPHLYKHWQVVSLENAPNITIKGRLAREVIFMPSDYRRQLAKLDYILDYQRGNLLNQRTRIDLTLGAQVPVQLITLN